MLAESEGLAPLKRTRAQQFSGLRPYQLGLTLRRIIWQERQDLNPHELIWNRSGYLYLTLLQKTLDARGRILFLRRLCEENSSSTGWRIQPDCGHPCEILV